MAKRIHPRIDPEDVLRGRVRPDAPALCALVRAVNPSGEELPAAERARRYAQKSRLQSLLVARFADEIEVVPDLAAGPGVVLLRHRPSGSTASHALVAELDDEARSWAQRRLDELAADPTPAPAPFPERRRPRARRADPDDDGPDGDAGTDDLLRAGQRALEAYDYDLARSLFTRALEHSVGAAAPAAALLDLLVEQLGADTDALALTGSLGAPALADPHSRRHLALAAARTGNRAGALAFLKDLRDPGTAGVFAALTRSALAEGDPEEAARDLAEVRGRDPSHPELAALESALEAAHAALWKPIEATVLALVADGLFEAAENAARNLPAGAARSPALRKALRTAGDHNRGARAAQLVAGAERALAAGEAQTAIALLRQSLVEHPENQTARVEQLLAGAEARERERAAALAAEPVTRLLAAADPSEALVAYLALAPDARALVRAGSPRPELARLDAAAVTATGARATVAAVLALARAERIAGDDPDAALALLQTHGKLLEGVRDAETVTRRAEAKRHERRRDEARRRFAEARALLAPYGVEAEEALWAKADWSADVTGATQARALLSNATVQLLDDPERTLAAKFQDAADTLLARHELISRLNAFVGRAEVIQARACLEEQIARAPARTDQAKAEARHQKLRDALDRAIQKRFGVCVAGEGARELERRGLARAIATDVAVPMPDLWGISLAERLGASCCVRNGRELLQAHSYGPFFFVRVIDFVEKPPLLRTFAVVRTPQPLTISTSNMTPEKVGAAGSIGAVLSLSLSDFRVLAWRPPVEPRAGRVPGELAPPWRLTSAALSADLRLAWMMEAAHGRPPRLRTLDLESMRITHDERREVAETGLDTLLGAQEAELAVLDPTGTIELRRANGRPLEGGRFALTATRCSLTAHPDGGVFAIAREHALALPGAVRLVPGAGTPLPQSIDGLAGGEVVGAVTDLDSGRIFVLHAPDDRHRCLFALRAEGATFVTLYRALVPCRSLLMLDLAGRTPSLLVVSRGVFDVVPLGAAPPELPVEPEPLPYLRVPRIRLLGLSCQDVPSPRLEASTETAFAMGQYPGGAVAWAGVVAGKNDPDAMYDTASALDSIGLATNAAELVTLALGRYPKHSLLQLQGALLLAKVGAWGKVRTVLEGLDETPLNAAGSRHFAHLMGLALLEAGEHEAAYLALTRGLRHRGPCDLDPLLAIAAPLDDPAKAPWPQRPLRALLRRVAAADACLAAGDAEGAVAQLDDLLVWEAREIQTMARLVRAMLDAGDERGPDRFFRKLFALATYLELVVDQTCLRRELFVRGRWSHEQLKKVGIEAAAWLEAFAESMPQSP
jgi:hypothetical protein